MGTLELVAVTRAVSPCLGACELTHREREPIDAEAAEAEHCAYEAALGGLGCEIVRVAPAPDHPDSVFVEDTAVVLDEVAVVTRPGASSRRGEVGAVAEVLARYRPVAVVEAPATLDGGDVLRVGRTLWVGQTERTNVAGIAALERVARPHGYSVVPVPLTGCLHLKTAVTAVAPGLLLLNPDWVDPRRFEGLDWLAVDADEPNAANGLALAGVLVYPAEHRATAARLTARGVTVVTVPTRELQKAEAGVTCCSLVFPRRIG